MKFDEYHKTLNEMRIDAQNRGKTMLDHYLERRRSQGKAFLKKIPNTYNAVFKKKYIVPTHRQLDYINQDACNFLMLDLLVSMAKRGMVKDDEVWNLHYISALQQLKFDRPTFFLERELGTLMIKPKSLPESFFLSDINWRFPALRVYLPRNLISLNPANPFDYLMYLDIVKLNAGERYMYPPEMIVELDPIVPNVVMERNGFAVSGNLHFDSTDGSIGYAAISRLDDTTIKRLLSRDGAFDLNPNTLSTEQDSIFIDRSLILAVNVLLFLSSYPLEYEPKKELIRAPKQEGKRTISGLYKARFVGESQLRPYHPSQPKNAPVAPTGVQMASQWRSGHWQRIWYGPGKSEHRLQWIQIYGTGEFKKQEPEKELT